MHLPGHSEIDAFCGNENPQLGVTISIGFEGMNLDRTNSYLEFGANGQQRRIGFDIFPSCPPPVLTGGDCSENDDCISAANDPESSSCSAFDGYCKNHPVYKSSVACSGTCIEKLADGDNCSKEAVNIHALDPTHLLQSGDGNACKSGKCFCEICAGNSGLANEYGCSANSDCASGWCEGIGSLCSGTCKPKRQPGHKCYFAYDDSCTSGKCSSHHTCKQCQDSNGKIPNSPHNHPSSHDTHVCQNNSQCVSGWCEGGNLGCGGRCKRKRYDSEDSYGGDGNSCYSGRAQCGSCGKRSKDESCSEDSDCIHNDCTACFGCPKWGCKGHCKH